jgi:hypothetical protein
MDRPQQIARCPDAEHRRVLQEQVQATGRCVEFERSLSPADAQRIAEASTSVQEQAIESLQQSKIDSEPSKNISNDFPVIPKAARKPPSNSNHDRSNIKTKKHRVHEEAEVKTAVAEAAADSAAACEEEEDEHEQTSSDAARAMEDSPQHQHQLAVEADADEHQLEAEAEENAAAVVRWKDVLSQTSSLDVANHMVCFCDRKFVNT